MRAVSARQQGDTYQERAFMLKACRLLKPHTNVAQVGYEIPDVRHFDDIAVIYSEPILDAHGALISADYYQIKWHVDGAGAITCDALTDPAFIGSKSTSLLQRLHEAAKATPARDECARFNLVTTWGVDHRDRLAKLFSGRDGELRLDVLFGQKRFSRLVQQWSDHLGIGLWDLREVLSRLRLCASSMRLDQLSRLLGDSLSNVGLIPIEHGVRSSPYDSLVERLLSEGKHYFTAEDFKNICEREGLWVGDESTDETPLVGIRSFTRFAEHMEDEVDSLLDLLDLFEGRQIASSEYWNSEVGPRIGEFISKSVVPLGRCQLNLSSHSSVAFAAGYELDPKAGTQISLIQNTSAGRAVWEFQPESQATCRSQWKVSEVEVSSAAEDVGIVLSVTHDALPEVLEYVRDYVPGIGRMLIFKIAPEIGPMSVVDGNHAWHLAQEIVRVIRGWRPAGSSDGPLHVFGAAPNGLVFFLGRLARSLGQIQLYEHAFDSDWPARYQRSLSLPIE